MYFESLSAALHMDGHGVFVWSAYLITIFVIGWLLIVPVRREKLFFQQLQGKLKRQHRDKN